MATSHPHQALLGRTGTARTRSLREAAGGGEHSGPQQEAENIQKEWPHARPESWERSSRGWEGPASSSLKGNLKDCRQRGPPSRVSSRHLCQQPFSTPPATTWLPPAHSQCSPPLFQCCTQLSDSKSVLCPRLWGHRHESSATVLSSLHNQAQALHTRGAQSMFHDWNTS